jgi:hypothetical protein
MADDETTREYTRTGGLVAAAPCFVIAAALVVVWIVPTAPVFGGGAFPERLVVAEIFTVVYAGFAGVAGALVSWVPRGRELAVVGVQFAVGVWIAWLFSHQPAVAAFIGIVVLMRIAPQLVDLARRRRIDPDEPLRMIMLFVWAFSAAIAVQACGRVMDRYGLSVPALGLTPEVEAGLRAAMSEKSLLGLPRGDGRLADSVAGLLFYFIVVGIGSYVLNSRTFGEPGVAARAAPSSGTPPARGAETRGRG